MLKHNCELCSMAKKKKRKAVEILYLVQQDLKAFCKLPPTCIVLQVKGVALFKDGFRCHLKVFFSELVGDAMKLTRKYHGT